MLERNQVRMKDNATKQKVIELPSSVSGFNFQRYQAISWTSERCSSSEAS